MKVLVIGSGGREHVLAWKLAQSPLVKEIYAAPGNPGIWDIAHRVEADHNSLAALADFAETEGIDLTVVGPEAYLALGLVDEFDRRGLVAFGPSKAASEIEADKSFAKDFMKRHGIPTAEFAVFEEYDAALAYLSSHGAPIVIKASGLAGGKGAYVCRTDDEARSALADLMKRRVLGEAGQRVVIEEFLQGEEASLLALTDGRTILPMLLAQDHKPVGDGDEGPNTGGMGAYAPAGVLNREETEAVMRSIVQPTIAGLNAEGRTYRGVLYVGLIKTAQGPKVIEYNCRFGDPEAQAVLPLLRSDLAALCLAAAEGNLQGGLEWDTGSAVCVVLASGGYPGQYRTGLTIEGLAEAAAHPGVMIFHAGTSMRGGKVVTAGGRVLNAVGVGPEFGLACERVYAAVSEISFPGVYYRRDIAWRESQRQNSRIQG